MSHVILLLSIFFLFLASIVDENYSIYQLVIRQKNYSASILTIH